MTISDRHAADGFPIYALTGSIDSSVSEMVFSYRLKYGNRPSGDELSGIYDGTFLEDYESVEGHGNLDECNGAMTISSEYPFGTYVDFLTNNYLLVPRCFAGTPDQSFKFTPR